MLTRNTSRRLLRCGPHTLSLGGAPLMMGILNLTPDSFCDGGRYGDCESAAVHAEAMAAAGASIIDVGGESTRPGAPPVSAREEMDRVLPVIRRLARLLDIPISIDTSKADVARAAFDAGAAMLNDVTALRGDESMAAVASAAGVPVVLMHMRGTPRDMHTRTEYRDVVREVYDELHERIVCAENAGIPRDRLIVDPGIGFAKTSEQSLLLIANLDRFKELGLPVLVGHSNKSFIHSILGSPVNERTLGTAVVTCWSALLGADIIRVHDVAAMGQAIRMTEALRERRSL